MMHGHTYVIYIYIYICVCCILTPLLSVTLPAGPEYRSRCSDSLWAGLSGDQVLVGGEILCIRVDRSAHPASCTRGYHVSFMGVGRPGRGDVHPPLPKAEVKGKVNLYMYPSSGSSRPILGRK